MHQVRKIQITTLNPHLICVLCGGYYIDATTIIECLHSFCRSCIVKYLENNKFCPICEVQVHKTKPLLNIRSDQTLQDIVYKLVPGLYSNEMRLRREFYSKHPDALPSNAEDRGEMTERYIYLPDETISLTLEYSSSDLDGNGDHEEEGDCNVMRSRRFLRCPAAVSVGLLKRLLRGKYGLEPEHPLDVFYGDSLLSDEYTLVDLAYIFHWRRKGPMKLTYRIYQCTVSNIPILNGNNAETNEEEEDKNDKNDTKRAETISDTSETNSGNDQEMCECKKQETKEEEGKKDEPIATTESKDEVGENKGTDEGNNNQEPLKEVQLEISESGIMSVQNIDVSNCAMATVLSSGKASDEPVSEKPVISAVSVSSSTSPFPHRTSTPSREIATNGQTSPIVSTPSNTVTPAKKPVSPVGYKTLKLPPKRWNPIVSRVPTKRPASTSNAEAHEPLVKKPSLLPTSSPKAPRFFKVRNASQLSTNNVTSKSTTTIVPTAVTSIASVTESPVQEVAVNLTKSAEGLDKISPKEPRASSPSQNNYPPAVSPPSTRPSSAPAQLKPQVPCATAGSSNEDATSKLRALLVPTSSTAAIASLLNSTATSSTTSVAPVSSTVDSANVVVSDSSQLRFPSWLPQPSRSSLSLSPTVPFLNRSPLPAHLISSFMAPHSHYPYLTPSLSLGMLTPAHVESKKTVPITSNLSASSSTLITSPMSKPTVTFPTPTFSLNSLHSYAPGLPLLSTFPRELTGPLYTTFSSRTYPPPRSPRNTNFATSKSSAPSSGGGFHSSLPPTVTTTTSNTSVLRNNETKTSTAVNKTGNIRPLMPRRSVAPPPPLVPIRTTITATKIPNLVSIKEETKGGEGPVPDNSAKNCTVVESHVVRSPPSLIAVAADNKEKEESVLKAVEVEPSPKTCSPQENGSVSIEATEEIAAESRDSCPNKEEARDLSVSYLANKPMTVNTDRNGENNRNDVKVDSLQDSKSEVAIAT